MDKIIEPVATPMPQPLLDEVLQPGHELRIYNIEDHIKVLMTDGKAEVFGRELPLKMPIYFHQGEKIAIYTYHGAKIQVSGKCEPYSSSQTPMYQYINIHSAFNVMRNEASKNRKIGPTILITGS